MEILEYEGMYFVPDVKNHSVPWQHLHFSRVDVLYFTNVDLNHQANDITAEALWANILMLAGMRREWSDCTRGLMVAIELMAVNLHRHQRIAQQNLNADGTAITINAYLSMTAGGKAPLPWTNGGPRPNVPAINHAECAFTNTTDPALRTFSGDINEINPTDYYRRDEWQFLMLDAYGQFAFSPITRIQGTSWLLDVLNFIPINEIQPLWVLNISS